MTKSALISVSNKKNIEKIAKFLEEQGYQILSTGGTFKFLQEHNINVTPVEKITDFPEIMDGRVKTLHPKIHGGLLGDLDISQHVQDMQKHGISPISIVIINLYPFEEVTSRKDHTWAQAIENIDIGGPTMIRSAAKNHRHVTVIFDPADYDKVIAEIKANQKVSLKTNELLAQKAFAYTSYYDAKINQYMASHLNNHDLEKWAIPVQKKANLRYGENPHQKGEVYASDDSIPYSLLKANQLHGKELSYNNYNDADAAINILQEFQDPTFVGLKHKNPCGVGVDKNIYNAWKKAYEGDPVSIFGGIIATNRPLTKAVAIELNKIFLEIIIAPSYEKDALEILKTKKNLRLLQLNISDSKTSPRKVNTINGGFLIQDVDNSPNNNFDEWKRVTKANNQGTFKNDLIMAWKIVKHLKSNAVCVVQDGQLMGIGTGQTNRVLATKHALEWNKDKLTHAVLASDAFFPMPDSISLIAQYPIKAIVQTGGSIKDNLVIDEANKHDLEMFITGKRHFLH